MRLMKYLKYSFSKKSFDLNSYFKYFLKLEYEIFNYIFVRINAL